MGAPLSRTTEGGRRRINWEKVKQRISTGADPLLICKGLKASPAYFKKMTKGVLPALPPTQEDNGLLSDNTRALARRVIAEATAKRLNGGGTDLGDYMKPKGMNDTQAAHHLGLTESEYFRRRLEVFTGEANTVARIQAMYLSLSTAGRKFVRYSICQRSYK